MYSIVLYQLIPVSDLDLREVLVRSNFVGFVPKNSHYK